MDDETPLAARIKDRIKREGPLSFDAYMAAALYDPALGFYARGPRIGPGGDFSTSVRFAPFRRAVARFAGAAWRAVGSPESFRIVELGAGTGQLARAVTEEWRAARPDVELEYVTVDASPALRALQAAVPGVRSVASMDALPPAPGLAFGNEVLDALPVKRVMGDRRGGLVEIVVDVDAKSGCFRERLRPVADPAIEQRFRDVGVWPQPNQVCDVAPALDEFVRDAASLVEKGLLMFVDYGDPAPRLYAPTRLNGTLAAYRAGGKFHDWYARVGEQDLTADVDFTTVTRAAEDAGMRPLGIATQGDWLRALGVEELGDKDDVDAVAGDASLGSAFFALAFEKGLPPGASIPGFR